MDSLATEAKTLNEENEPAVDDGRMSAREEIISATIDDFPEPLRKYKLRKMKDVLVNFHVRPSTLTVDKRWLKALRMVCEQDAFISTQRQEMKDANATIVDLTTKLEDAGRRATLFERRCDALLSAPRSKPKVRR